jgi:putative flippase GtrA
MLLAVIMFPAVGFTWHAETVAHVTGVVSPAVTSYLLHSSYTFGK